MAISVISPVTTSASDNIRSGEQVIAQIRVWIYSGVWHGDNDSIAAAYLLGLCRA